MTTRWTRIQLVALLSAALLATGACGKTSSVKNKGDVRPLSEPNTVQQLDNGEPYVQPLTDQSVDEDGDGNRGRIDQPLMKKLVNTLNGVQASEVVIFGRDVLIGVELDNMGKRKINEKQIFSSLTWQYPEYNYYITSNEQYRSQIASLESIIGANKVTEQVRSTIEHLVLAIGKDMAGPR